MVLKFGIASFRQQYTETPSNNGDSAIDQHGNGVMIDIQEPDQRRQDARHTSTHGVQTYTILPAGTGGEVISSPTSLNMRKYAIFSQYICISIS